jgi:hypothetical protein
LMAVYRGKRSRRLFRLPTNLQQVGCRVLRLPAAARSEDGHEEEAKVKARPNRRNQRRHSLHEDNTTLR